MDRIDKDEELVCPLCGGRLFWMPVSHIYACEHCKQSYSERNGVYMQKKRKSTAEKSSAVGDAAKLREALVQAELFVGNIVRHGHQTLVPGDKCTACDGAEELRDMICAALAAPATAEKSSAVGDAAKLREALDESRRIASDLGGCRLNDYWKLNEIVRVCEAALAAPARNCDMPLVVDGPADNNADKAWIVFKRHNPDAYFDVPGLLRCIDWLLAPATEKEGGNNG